MKKVLISVLKYGLIGIVGIILILALVIRFSFDTKMSDQEFEEYFSQMNIQPHHNSYEVDGHHMHYVSLKAEGKPTVLFVHGSPGGWNDYKAFFTDSTLSNHAQLVSVDRVGYGGSDPGHPESSLYMQAALIRPILDSLQDHRPIVVVGHSFGGPVATRLAMDYPDLMDAVVLVAGLTDPVLEDRLSIQSPLRSKWLRWILPEGLDVSNREIVPLKGELQGMMEGWENIKAEYYIIQGGKDILVEPENADFAENMLVNTNFTTIRIPQENHFIPWENPNEIKRAVRLLLDCLQKDDDAFNPVTSPGIMN